MADPTPLFATDHAGEVDESMTDWATRRLAEGLSIVLCEACWWWSPAERPDPARPTQALHIAPTECPECRSHHGRRRPLVWATARIEVDRG